ncbi:MAG TPA: aminotransferase class III-fold pyridoxal phosphate-dependent enzyme [Planctomycetota bacterium]|nr:aminotransferase class III-fold pyridoxal phosphate-dependent enzyme [Planctomycetota bacterium]
MSDILAGLPATIDGYGLAAEKRRYDYPSITAAGVTLNRASARVDVRGEMDPPRHAKVREDHLRAIFTTTHSADSPVVELGYPMVGPYVACPAGVYMDCQLGVAQRLIDENHPAFTTAIERLMKHRLLFRREINTDDFFDVAPGAKGEIHTPQDLARLVTGLAKEAFPIVQGYKCFFSNSGTEAIEAGLKLAQVVRYKRLVEKHGLETVKRLMAQLEIPLNEALERNDRSTAEPVYKDYPFFIFAFESAFHGRTMGALSVTNSKKRHQLGYSKLQWVRHFPWNGAAAKVAETIDARDLPEILDAEGGVKAVLAQGKVPKDLAAVFVAEPFQGEGGYRLGDRRAFQELGAVLKRFGILFMLDEVQSFGRTGTAFCSQHMLNEPDILATAKGAVVGVTIARAEFEQYLHSGWHSNTWGGGKIFDNEMAYATVDALRSYRDPVFDGMGYLDNCKVKGQYLSLLLERLRERHPDLLVEHSGLGLMQGITVRRREELVPFAWNHGLKLLGSGLPGETARVRLLFLADTTARELEDFAVTFDRILAAAREKLGKTTVGAAER